MRLKRILSVLCVSVVLLLLSSCSGKGGLWNPVGIIAEQEKHLWIVTMLLMSLVVVPVIILTLFICWRYRDGAGGTYKPHWTHSTTLEVICWGIPTVIILTLAIIVWNSTHALNPYKPIESDKKPVEIEVVALDWKWMFIYPEYNIATINYLKIPKDRPINFKITAAAPMNSFMIPELGGQIYAMTGMTTKLHLLATHEGSYRGFSANYTGTGFAEMQFNTYVTTDKDFNSWVKEVKDSDTKALTWDYFWSDLVKQSIANPVAYYSNVDKNLFMDITMSFMAPNYKDGGMKNMGDLHHIEMSK